MPSPSSSVSQSGPVSDHVNYSLRRSSTIVYARSGRGPAVLLDSPPRAERLGQATVSITLDTYSHAIPAMQGEAAALIAGLVFAP
jgi:hypothetical protein